MSICNGFTKKGLPCKKRVKTGKYCFLHNEETKIKTPKIPVLEKPDDCIICTEPLNEKYPLSPCGHWVHRNCQLKSGSRCVFCRTEIDLTPVEKIEINHKKEQDRKNEEARNLEMAREIASRDNRLSLTYSIISDNNIIISNTIVAPNESLAYAALNLFLNALDFNRYIVSYYRINNNIHINIEE